MNEQSLHLALPYPDEAHELAITITDAKEVLERQETGNHEGLDELDVRLRKEMVRRADRGLPHLQQRGAIIRPKPVDIVL
jgi:hypothetical protein